MMDDTIRLLLETDADAEVRRAAAKEECAKCIADAKATAAARNEALAHHTRDLIYEIEEAEKEAFEQKYHVLSQDYEQQSAAMHEQFEGHCEPLLDMLTQQVLRRAEQSYGN